MRLTRSVEYARVFARAVRSRDDCFTLLARDNELGHARIGLAIARRAVPTAFQRNRIKRQVREQFRRRRHNLPAIDIVVLAQPGLGAQPGHLIRRSLDKHWRRLIQKCARSPSP